jgi:hypothetical protein
MNKQEKGQANRTAKSMERDRSFDAQVLRTLDSTLAAERIQAGRRQYVPARAYHPEVKDAVTEANSVTAQRAARAKADAYETRVPKDLSALYDY